MSDAKLTAVVVTYCSEKTLPAAIEAARRCHDAGVMRTVYIDNASPDRTSEVLETARDWATVMHNNANAGFARGCNRGLSEVRTPLTIFLNPDATLEPEAAQRLVRFMEETPRAGICGPAIITGKGKLQIAGVPPTPWGDTFERRWRGVRGLMHRGWFPIEPGSSPVRCGWVIGAALVIRTDLARTLGGFDPTFFMYWEEGDLCKRAHSLGWEIWAIGEAVAHHVGGASSENDTARVRGCIARHFYQSRFYYFRKHYGWLTAAAVDVIDLAILTADAVWNLVRGRRPVRLPTRLRTSLFSSPGRAGGEGSAA